MLARRHLLAGLGDTSAPADHLVGPGVVPSCRKPIPLPWTRRYRAWNSFLPVVLRLPINHCPLPLGSSNSGSSNSATTSSKPGRPRPSLFGNVFLSPPQGQRCQRERRCGAAASATPSKKKADKSAALEALFGIQKVVLGDNNEHEHERNNGAQETARWESVHLVTIEAPNHKAKTCDYKIRSTVWCRYQPPDVGCGRRLEGTTGAKKGNLQSPGREAVGTL